MKTLNLLMMKSPIKKGLETVTLAAALISSAVNPAEAKDRAKVVDLRSGVAADLALEDSAVSGDAVLTDDELFKLIADTVSFDSNFRVEKARRGVKISGQLGELAHVTWSPEMLFKVAGENGEPFEKVSLSELRRVLRYVAVRDELFMAGAKRRMKVLEGREKMTFDFQPRDSLAVMRVIVGEKDFKLGLFHEGQSVEKFGKSVQTLAEIDAFLESGGGFMRKEEFTRIEGEGTENNMIWTVRHTLRDGRRETITITRIKGGEPDQSGPVPRIVGGEILEKKVVVKEGGKIISDDMALN